jgi:CelD/BcsL family acetyltransferase involved in cellulose biosynthesis
MITRILRSIEALQQIEPDWHELLARQAGTSPFQTAHYNQIWWSTLGGGEWEQGDLWLFAGYDQADRLIGLAPLFIAPGEQQALRLIGSHEISDYLDLIVDAGHAKAFIEELLTQSMQQDGSAGQRLILDNLLEDSPNIPLLEQVAKSLGLKFARERTDPAPLLMLPSSMAGYLEGLGSKQRKEFKRKMRRAAEYPARVTWRLADQANTFSDEIEIFLELMANDAEKREFLSEPMKQHFRTLALEGSPEGWIKLAFLEVSGNPIFGYLNFIAQNRIWVYNSGFDPDHFALSPGWVLMGHLIEWAIQNQLEAIDFLRGDEQYKNRLGGIDRFVCRLTIES